MPFDTPDAGSSRSLTASRPLLTAATALAMVAADDTLTPARKREQLSALKCVVRLSRLPASTLVLSPPELREWLLRHSAGGFALSLSRWRSIKSALRAVLRNYGVIESKLVPTDPAWSVLLTRLDSQRRCYLLELARFATADGIAPSAVDHAVFERFLVYLNDRTLTPNPRKLVGAARSLWNRCHATLPDWPGHQIAPLADPDQYIIPLHCFPASFSNAVDAYCARLGTELPDDFGDEEDEPASGAEATVWVAPLMKALRPSTIATRRDHLRWGASALVASGVPIEQVTSLVSLVSSQGNVRAIMRFLLARARGKPSTTAMHVLEVLRIVAKYEARLPQAQLDKIGAWRAKVMVPYKGITQKNRQLVRRLLDPARERALLHLPTALMAAARTLRDKDPLEAARLALRATAIRVLIGLPMRLKNLIGLRLDQHLKRPDPRRPSISHIEIPADEAKAEAPLVMNVSRALSDHINEWVDDFRPILAAKDCLYLFPGQGTGNRSITPQALRDAIKATTARHVGVAIHPHGFRHVAAARYLEGYPGEWEAVGQLLGHATSATAKRHYAIINNKHVFDRFDALAAPPRATKAPARKPARPPSQTRGPAKGGLR